MDKKTMMENLARAAYEKGAFNGTWLYAENGEIVVALVDDSATVKRFYKENGHYRLQPENDDYDPIIVDEVILLGKVISLIRNY